MSESRELEFERLRVPNMQVITATTQLMKPRILAITERGGEPDEGEASERTEDSANSSHDDRQREGTPGLVARVAK